MGFVQKVGQYVIDSISEKYENTKEGAKEYKDTTVDSTWENLGEMDRDRWEMMRQDYTREEAEEVREAHGYVENPSQFLQEHPDKAYTAERITDEIRQMDGGEDALKKAASDADESPEQYVQERLREDGEVLGTPDRQSGDASVYYIISQDAVEDQVGGEAADVGDTGEAAGKSWRDRYSADPSDDD